MLPSSSKGQIFSKGLLGVLKMSSFIRFLGEFEDTKSPLEIIWPLGIHRHPKQKEFVKCYDAFLK